MNERVQSQSGILNVMILPPTNCLSLSPQSYHPPSIHSSHDLFSASFTLHSQPIVLFASYSFSFCLFRLCIDCVPLSIHGPIVVTSIECLISFYWLPPHPSPHCFTLLTASVTQLIVSLTSLTLPVCFTDTLSLSPESNE
jgi:hypothetical protein